jgi:urease accessory protein
VTDLVALLLLADSRLPAGTHAHSGGLEAAVAAGRVHDDVTLHDFLLGRLTTAGLVAAAFAAAAARVTGESGLDDACGRPASARPVSGPEPGELTELDAELDARTPSPAQRGASRRLGRQLLRAARAGWEHPALGAALAVHPDGPHQPIAFGAAAAAAGLGPDATAAAAALAAVTGPAGAATRLLGLDPDAVTGVLAALAPHVRRVAAQAADAAAGPVEDLPASSAPLLDISAEHHATWEVRLFAS